MDDDGDDLKIKFSDFVFDAWYNDFDKPQLYKPTIISMHYIKLYQDLLNAESMDSKRRDKIFEEFQLVWMNIWQGAHSNCSRNLTCPYCGQGPRKKETKAEKKLAKEHKGKQIKQKGEGDKTHHILRKNVDDIILHIDWNLEEEDILKLTQEKLDSYTKRFSDYENAYLRDDRSCKTCRGFDDLRKQKGLEELGS